MTSVNSLNSAIQLLKVLGDEIDREVRITVPLVLLRIAQAGDAGVDSAQVARELKISSSSMNRITQTLGDLHYSKDGEGFGLVERTLDSKDLRMRILRLTPKGQRVITKLFK